jgi:hypothetical protein
VHIHIAEPSPFESPSILLGENVQNLRVTRAHSHASEDITLLSSRLLSLPFDECTPEELLYVRVDEVQEVVQQQEVLERECGLLLPSMHRMLLPYVMNQSLMKLWNFPLSSDIFAPELTDRRQGDEQERKRIRLTADESVKNPRAETEETVVGVLIGFVPSKLQLHQCKSSPLFPKSTSVCFCSEFPRSHLLTTQHDFWKTLPSTSPALDMLHAVVDNVCDRNRVRVVALDCEMVLTTSGVEVARVTLVDDDDEHTVLLDCLVRPANEIIDYRTQHSGISAKSLQNVNISLDQVRLALLCLVSSESIVCGHSLENDWAALRMTHSRNVDTAQLYPHPRGYPLRHKLKFLAKQILGLNIQQTNRKNGDGHDSIEDAATALLLVKRKLEGGPAFGLHSVKGGRSETGRLPLFNRLGLRDIKCWLGWQDNVMVSKKHSLQSFHSAAMESCVGGDVEVVRHGDLDVLLDKLTSFLKLHKPFEECQRLQKECITIEEVEQQVLAPVKFCSLNITSTVMDKCKIDKLMSKLRTSLQALYPSEDAHGIIVLTSQSSMETVHQLRERRNVNLNNANSLSVSMWSSDLEMQFKAELKKSQMGSVVLEVI